MARDKQLAAILLRQFHSYIFAECGGAFADVYGYVEHRALRHPHEFSLRKFAFLEVQTAEHTAGRHRLVALHEIHIGVDICVEFVELEGFHKPTALVAETLRLNDVDSVDGSLEVIHRNFIC